MCVCVRASVHQRAIAVLRAGRPVKEPPLMRALIGKGEVLRLGVAAALAMVSRGWRTTRDESGKPWQRKYEMMKEKNLQTANFGQQ